MVRSDRNMLVRNKIEKCAFSWCFYLILRQRTVQNTKSSSLRVRLTFLAHFIVLSLGTLLIMISWNNRMRDEEVLESEGEEEYHNTTKRRKDNRIGHILCRNCLIKHVI
jgi:hypothetical protein